jgi:hypothetical protein
MTQSLELARAGGLWRLDDRWRQFASLYSPSVRE